MSAAMGLFQGAQERVRNSRGKRVIGVRAIEVLLYLEMVIMDKLIKFNNAITHICRYKFTFKFPKHNDVASEQWSEQAVMTSSEHCCLVKPVLTASLAP